MRGFLGWLLAIYVAVNGFTGVAVYGNWVTPTIIALLITSATFVTVSALFQVKLDWEVFGIEDVMLALMLAWWCASAILNFNAKSLQYVGMYLFIFGVGFWAFKLMLSATDSIERVLKGNLIGVVIVSVFAITSLIAWYVFSIDLQDLLPRTKEATAVYGGFVRRAYSLAPEPTVLGFYLNTLGPLAIWYLWRNEKWACSLKVVVTTSVVAAWFLTLSVATFVFMGVALSTAGVIAFVRQFAGTTSGSIKSGSKGAWWLGLGFVVIVTAVVMLGAKMAADPSLDRAVWKTAAPLVSKLTLDQSGSAQQRLERWSSAIESVQESSIFGRGPGFSSSREEGSSINWYLFVAAEGGIVAAFFGVLFVGTAIWRIASLDTPLSYVAFIGALAGALHLLVVATVQHPGLWTLIAIHSVFSRKGVGAA